MGNWLWWVMAAVLLAACGLYQWRQQQLAFLQRYIFHDAYWAEVQAQYPSLQDNDREIAQAALRQFFLIRWFAPQQTVYMPSQIADALWHAFIVDTQAYQRFCQQAFGRFFHHIPSYSMQQHSSTLRRTHMQATWNAAQQSAHLLPVAMRGGVPLLFVVDAELGIAGASYVSSDYEYWEQMRAKSSGCGGGSGCSGSSCDGGGSSCGGGCGGD